MAGIAAPTIFEVIGLAIFSKGSPLESFKITKVIFPQSFWCHNQTKQFLSCYLLDLGVFSDSIYKFMEAIKFSSIKHTHQ